MFRTIPVLLLYLLPCHYSVSETQSGTDHIQQTGKVIYQQGLLSDGKPLTAIGQGGIQLTGKQVTCANCHRRSGMGASEGEIISPAITGQILFNPRETSYKQLAYTRKEGKGVRPAYTEEDLRQAIRDGIGADGRNLDSFMPRFELTSDDLDALIAYLKVLGNKEAQGVSEEYIEFATVITPDVTDAKKSAMLSVIQTYIDDYNSGTRHEKRRADYSPWHKTWHYGSYRKWRLYTWQLTGKPDSWKQQLDLFYKKQPVFALVNGVGNDWQIMHRFCNERSLPCLFPTTDIPGNERFDSYTLYFSQGMILDAKLIAHHISQHDDKNIKSIVQIYNEDDGRAVIAAEKLNQIIQAKNNISVFKNIINNTKSVEGHDSTRFNENEEPYYLVFWGDMRDTTNNKELTNYIENASRVYISYKLNSKEALTAENELNDKIFIAQRFCLDKDRDRQLRRFSAWARLKKIPVTDDQVMSNAFFTMTTLADAIKHMRNNLSGDYLIERIEHMVDNTLFYSVYPHFSLGPDQRFASKGGYIVSYKWNNGALQQEAVWIIPNS